MFQIAGPSWEPCGHPLVNSLMNLSPSSVRVADLFVRYDLTMTIVLLETPVMTAKKDNRGKKTPHNITCDDDIKNIENFIKGLPAVPSHYCRSSTSKKYLPAENKNISAVYRGYKIQCESSKPQKNPVSETVFRNVFTTKFNIGFHTPKKDKCNICESMKNIG